ncbi:MAG: hypothetical protein IJ870_02600 [Alphaproteobacteria bacterium]|nr:hypothetical protein [Alphaproteobacteria bacterium]
MKKYILILLCCVTSMNIQAKSYQYDKYGQISRMLEDNGAYTQYFYENGQLISAKSFNSKGIQTGSESYSYDDKNQTRLTYVGDTLTRKEVFNSQNYYNMTPWSMPISRIYYDQGVVEYYSFNDKGLAYKEEQYTMVSGQEDKDFYNNRNYRRYYEFGYTYDQEDPNRVTSRTRTGSAYEVFNYEYDEYGNVIAWKNSSGQIERSQIWDDPQWKNKVLEAEQLLNSNTVCANLDECREIVYMKYDNYCADYTECQTLKNMKNSGACDAYDDCLSLYNEQKQKTKASERELKRIYTVEEAERVSKKTGNTFKLRYK